jgi:outer membrane protein OmpA-like peptidoglycan-associated protein
MKRALLPAVLCCMWALACIPKHVSAPTPPDGSLVVLLPDTDTGLTGRATVTNNSGSVELTAARNATFTATNRAPGNVNTLSDADVQQIFGGALSSMPPPQQHFTLFFRFDSDELTEESRALLRDVVNAVRGRAAPDVAIIGHTDTVGTPSANIELGLKRSTAVGALLVAAGLDPSVVELTSYGEAYLLIQTPNETPEPRNRSVEISVR